MTSWTQNLPKASTLGGTRASTGFGWFVWFGPALCLFTCIRLVSSSFLTCPRNTKLTHTHTQTQTHSSPLLSRAIHVHISTPSGTFISCLTLPSVSVYLIPFGMQSLKVCNSSEVKSPDTPAPKPPLISQAHTGDTPNHPKATHLLWRQCRTAYRIPLPKTTQDLSVRLT